MTLLEFLDVYTKAEMVITTIVTPHNRYDYDSDDINDVLDMTVNEVYVSNDYVEICVKD